MRRRFENYIKPCQWSSENAEIMPHEVLCHAAELSRKTEGDA